MRFKIYAKKKNLLLGSSNFIIRFECLIQTKEMRQKKPDTCVHNEITKTFSRSRKKNWSIGPIREISKDGAFSIAFEFLEFDRVCKKKKNKSSRLIVRSSTLFKTIFFRLKIFFSFSFDLQFLTFHLCVCYQTVVLIDMLMISFIFFSPVRFSFSYIRFNDDPSISDSNEIERTLNRLMKIILAYDSQETSTSDIDDLLMHNGHWLKRCLNIDLNWNRSCSFSCQTNDNCRWSENNQKKNFTK